jgi:hypothetical protein
MGQVKTPRESKRTRGTHSLSSTGGTSQDTGRHWQQGGKEHSLPVEPRGRDKSEHEESARERGALTNCEEQRKGWAMTAREGRKARGTHGLSGGEGGMTLDTERKRKGEGYSRTVERRGKDKSGHQE